MNNNSVFSKFFKSSEEVVSMFLGLIIVVGTVLLVVNYFQKSRGEVTVPGLSDQSRLELSSEKVGTVKNGDGSEYVVKKGDSLWKIAEAETGSGYNWTAIAKANNLKNPGVLYRDQKLIIPKIEAKAAIVKKDAEVTIKPGTTYAAVRGDSLWKIAVKTYGDGYKWTTIWKSNKTAIRDPNKLEIGMKILLE